MLQLTTMTQEGHISLQLSIPYVPCGFRTDIISVGIVFVINKIIPVANQTTRMDHT